MNTGTTFHTDPYHDPTSTFNHTFNKWLDDASLDEKDIANLKKDKKNQDRRIAQLCEFLLDLIRNEKAALKRNDSFINWLCQSRNQQRLQKLCKQVNT